MNKELIKSRFSKSLLSYNENAKIQKLMSEKLFSFLNKKEYKNILEIGCGTGFLTNIANKNLSYQNYCAIDIVKDCEIYIKKINPNINFINTDIEDFIKTEENYDLIISNAALQWVNDFENVINTLKSKLFQNGELVISTFGDKNFKEIFQITGETLTYYSQTELERMFPQSTIYSEIYTMEFDTPKEVLKHLKSTGVNSLNCNFWTKKDLQNFEKLYTKICPNTCILTYNPVYIIFH